MPRYFFHFASKDEFVPDYDGAVLDDLRAAHQRAQRLVWQTMPIMRGEELLRHWRVEVADESQYVHLTVLFPAVPALPRMPFGHRQLARPDRVEVRHKGPGGNADLLLRPPGGDGHHQ